MNRIQWIDISRGSAVILMLLAHVSPLIAGVPPILYMLFTLAPFIFFFLVGAGLKLSFERKNRPAKYYLLRGVLFMVGGLGYNLLEHNLSAGGFFQLIGAATIVSFVFERVAGSSPNRFFLFAIVSTIVYFPGQAAVSYLQPQGPLLDLLVRFFFLDYFSFFPWVSVVFLGLAFCLLDKEERTTKTNAFLLFAAIFSLAIGGFFRLLGTTLYFNPVSSSMFFVGLSSMAFLVLLSKVTLINIPHGIRRLLTLAGNHTIELLVIQWFFFRTIPYHFFPGQKADNWLIKSGYALLGVPGVIATAFLFERIPDGIWSKWTFPLYAITMGLTVLEVLQVVNSGFSIEVLLLAFVSSMIMSFTLEGLRILQHT